MITYDNKTKGITELDGRFILPEFKTCNEATFKASYIIASNVKCSGKITALFDLTVIGNLQADELDVKGRFICTGRCEVRGAVIVQNDIWAEEIRAESIQSHDRIIAQDIDIGTVYADGNIVAGKILAVEKLALSKKKILCGETVYGAGKIAANEIITGEPIDLDEGKEAVIDPYTYVPIHIQQREHVKDNLILPTVIELQRTNNWTAYIELLVNLAESDDDQIKFKLWGEVLYAAERIISSQIDNYKDVALLIWILEIANSYHFANWPITNSLLSRFDRHFSNMIQRDKSNIVCIINNYGEWLHALEILNRFGELLDNDVNNLAFELLVSNLGLKAKFVTERLSEKGWKSNV
jgi:hypothetical protein